MGLCAFWEARPRRLRLGTILRSVSSVVLYFQSVREEVVFHLFKS